MAQEPQIPSRHDLLKVKEGSISFLILMSASKTMGPQLLRSTLYSCILGLSPAVSGSHLIVYIIDACFFKMITLRMSYHYNICGKARIVRCFLPVNCESLCFLGPDAPSGFILCGAGRLGGSAAAQGRLIHGGTELCSLAR